MQMQDHWDEVYRTRDATTVSWHQPSAEISLSLIDKYANDACSVIDVGGGASSLVDALLERPGLHVTVLDIAKPALQTARDRLGESALRARWEVADITRWVPQRSYDVWHDRAVFHFLTLPNAREEYKSALETGTIIGSVVIVATFALSGPERCSGLVVQRYDPDTLAKELGSSYRLLDAFEQGHKTPAGNQQIFNWCVFQRAE
jgi:hypothetical protein